MTQITVIGDLFVRSQIFEEMLRRHLGPVAGPLSFTSVESDWPESHLRYDNEEIEEFIGEPDEVARLAAGAEVFVTQVAPVTRSVIEAAKNLRIIACCRGGPVNVNVKAATEKGIPVVYAPGRNSQAVVEFTLGLLLTEYKSISRAHCALTRGEWRGDLYRYDRAPRELKGQVVGLVGLGIIARMLVPYLKPFETRILAYDPYVPAQTFAELGVEPVDLPTLLRESDVVSLHARVTPQTKGMMGAEQFRLMKPGAYFINTARGPLVDYDALYQALTDGHLAGAALDTFGIEPPPAGWPLLSLDNVTLTPHIGGSSKETAYRAAEIVARDVANFYAGRPLIHCINRPG